MRFHPAPQKVTWWPPSLVGTHQHSAVFLLSRGLETSLGCGKEHAPIGNISCPIGILLVFPRAFGKARTMAETRDGRMTKMSIHKTPSVCFLLRLNSLEMVCPTTPLCPWAISVCDETLLIDHVVPAVGRLPNNILTLDEQQHQEVPIGPKQAYGGSKSSSDLRYSSSK